jgi:hypothetical protein
LMCSYSRCSFLPTPRKCFFGTATSDQNFGTLMIAVWPRAALGDRGEGGTPKTERSDLDLRTSCSIRVPPALLPR